MREDESVTITQYVSKIRCLEMWTRRVINMDLNLGRFHVKVSMKISLIRDGGG